jgi:ribosomal protein L37AE/L43A
MSWEKLDDPPEWVISAAREERKKLARRELDKPLLGEYRIYYGDTFVYKVKFTRSNNGHHKEYHRQLKSDHFETTSEEGTCPNCQAYVRRMDGDDYLTCHRCGWQYNSLAERIKKTLSL